MKTDMKPQTAWAIAAPNGNIIAWTADDARSEEIQNFKNTIGKWPQMYRKGFRCVRVRIEVIEQEGEG